MSIQWYTRRNGVVRGPYPAQQVGRYILLGRICDSDELRSANGEWKRLTDYPELIPAVMKLPPSVENRLKLKLARLQADERRPGNHQRPEGERRAACRAGSDSCAGTTPRATADRYLSAYGYLVVFIALLVLALGLVYREQGAGLSVTKADCSASPTPGVNWSYCNLSGLRTERADLLGASVRNALLEAAQLAHARLVGADLEFSSLNLINLRSADLSRANLRGAGLRNSDLRGAKLVGANLSYADLSGALLAGSDLRGARLDHAVWIDERRCGAGSLGVCQRRRANAHRDL